MPSPPLEPRRTWIEGDEDAWADASLRRGLARRFIRGTRIGLVGHGLAALAVAAMFRPFVDGAGLAVWLGVLFASLGLQALLLRSVGGRADEPEVVSRRLLVGTVLAAIGWGTGAAILPPSASQGLGAAIILFTGLVAAGTATLVAHPTSFHLYSGILLVAVTAVEVVFEQGQADIIPLALAGLFWAAMVAVHRGAHAELVDSLVTAARLEWREAREAVERQVLLGLLRGAPGAVVILDPAGRILQANDSAARLAGIGVSDMEGTSLEELLEGTEVLTGLRPLLEEARLAGSARGEVTFTPADGRPRWFRVSVSRGEGVVEDTLFIQGENITSLKEAEAARLEAEELYRALVESAHDLVFRVDAEGHWTFLNEAAREIYGAPPAELLGRSFQEFQAPGSREPDLAAFARVLSGEELLDYETVHVDIQGQPHNLSFSARRIVDAEGRPVGAQGTVRDVTERVSYRKTLEELASQGELIRSLLNASQDLIFIKDAEGVYWGCNDAFARQLGRPEAEIVGRRDEDLYPDWQAESFREGDRDLFESGASKVEEEWLETPDGRLRLFQTVKTPQFTAAGEPRGVIGISRDVTESRLEEERSRQVAREAERASRMKTAFLANMSHEIRTPMNGVLGMTEILLDSGLTPEQARYAEQVRSSAESLLAILNDILDLSKIEAGRLEVEDAPFDLHGTVSATARLLGVAASRRQNELLVDIRPDVPQAVAGDAVRIRQVLTNLVGNAVKFTEGGEVVVSVGLEEDAGDLAWIRFSVRDTGIGIPSDKLEAIFEEFQQADASTTRTHGGTGLGLAISRRLVRLMGGEITVTSREGEGSEFSFLLPLRRAPEGSLPRETGRETGTVAGARVLVVDDNATNRRILRGFLEGAGATVEEEDSVDAGLRALREAQAGGDPCDAVILDVQMPLRGGFDFLEELRGDPALAGTPVMILASAMGPGDGARAREMGVRAFLQKPASRAEVLTGLTTALGPEDMDRVLEPEPGSPLATQPLHILVAEDNPVNQQIVVSMLTRQGHRVVVAENGEVALRRLRAHRPDLVLMDLQMPVLDGIEATRRIRQDPELSDLPVIAVTAHALAEERQRCREVGMQDFLSKPFRPHALLALVDRWGRRGVGADPAPVDPGAPTTMAPGTPGESAALAPPVDLDGFRAIMREAGIESVVEPTLGLFRGDAPQRIVAIEEAAAAGDLPGLRSAAHAYKSMAGNIRALRLQRLLVDLEEAARTGREREALEQVAGVREEHDAVMAWLAFEDGDTHR